MGCSKLAVQWTSTSVRNILALIPCVPGFPGGSDGKESACNEGDPVQSLGQEDLLEKGMATHSNILSWRIPWTKEPGGLQSMESQ